MTYMGGSVAALAGDRNTWKGRADQAWGPSDVWNSGASWEGMYGTANADAATWQSRANQAWGPSDVWNSGESWEAAYNRVLPAALTTNDPVIGATSQGQVAQVMATVTAPISGQYHLNGHMTFSTGGGTNQWRLDIYVNGVSVATGQTQQISSPSNMRSVFYRGFVSAGQSMQLVSVLLGGTLGSISPAGQFFTTFIPTQANPH